jgi:hypothetical protein
LLIVGSATELVESALPSPSAAPRGGDYEAAAAAGEEYLRNHPPMTVVGWQTVYAMTALAYAHLGRPARALEICEQALAHATPDERAYFAMSSCANRRTPSCSRSMVEVEHAAEALAAHNTAAVGGIVVLCGDQFVTEPLVIALCVIVGDVLLHDLTQVTFTQRDDARQALAPDGADEPLGECV